MSQFTQLLIYVLLTLVGYGIAGQLGGLTGFIIALVVVQLLQRRWQR